MNKYLYAITFVSEDRPGIVAQVTKVLYERGFNIKDSSSTLLQRIFSMILLVEHMENFLPEEIKSFFSLDLAPSVHVLANISEKTSMPTNRYVISVYGADKPGIVHTITEQLCHMGVNIVDLQTQTTGTPPNNTYIMILEVLVPAALKTDWMAVLKQAAESIKTDITVRKLETYEL